MKLNNSIAAAALVALGVTVATHATHTHAARGTTALTTVVPTGFEATWNALLQRLDDGDFTINASIKESSTIRVLLQSQTPSTWVDCGTISVSSQHKIFGNRNYKFLAANSVRYMVADEKVNELIDVERRTTLNALASIKLTPMAQGTQVDVDAQYVMKFRTREFGRNIAPRSLDGNMDFTSSGQATVTEEIREGAEMKLVTVDCRPTGELERRIVGVLGAPTG